jgi:hypothetical protein
MYKPFSAESAGSVMSREYSWKGVRHWQHSCKVEYKPKFKFFLVTVEYDGCNDYHLWVVLCMKLKLILKNQQNS